MATFGAEYTKILRNAFETYKTVENAELRAGLQGRALVDALTYIRDQLREKRDQIQEVRLQIEERIDEVEEERNSATKAARRFEAVFQLVQGRKNRAYAELQKLKSQEHAREGVGQGEDGAVEQEGDEPGDGS